MPFDPVTWGSGFVLTTTGKWMLEQFSPDLPGKLQIAIKTWAEGLPEDIWVQPEALFSRLHADDDLEVPCLMQLRKKLKDSQVPSIQDWFDAISELRHFQARKYPPGELQPFFDATTEQVQEPIQALAEIISSICQQDEKLFRATTLTHLFEIRKEVESLRMVKVTGHQSLERNISGQSENWFDVSEAQQTYLDFIIKRNRFIDPRGIRVGSITLPLNQVHILLTCDRERTEKEIGQQIQALRGSEYSLLDYEKARFSFVEDQHYALAKAAGWVEQVELPSTVRDHTHLVFLGDPGAGKTTLLRFLALRFALETREGVNSGTVRDDEGHEFGAARLPIPVRISEYAAEFVRNPNLSLRHFLPTPFGNCEIAPEILKKIFDSAIKNGQALFLFDGLDEVIQTGDRVQIAQQIEDFTKVVPEGNRFVVTSRIAGYQSARLGGPYHQFTLRKFERPQIESFLKRWCPAAEVFYRPDESPEETAHSAQAEIDGLLKAVDSTPGVASLATNPLMLTMLALIHRRLKRFPSRRIELYHLAIKILLEDWQLARTNVSIQENEALLLLAPLASWIHTHKPTGLIKIQQVKERLGEYLANSRNQSSEDPKIQTDVEEFLRTVQEQTGVFIEREPGLMGFLHATFQDYFVARMLLRPLGTAGERISRNRHNPRWRESILLAIGYLSETSPEDACDLIAAAVLAESEGFNPSLFEDVLHRDLLLAVECLGDCDTTEPKFRKRTIEKLIEIFFVSQNHRLEGYILSKLQNCRGSDTEKEALGQIIKALKERDSRVRASAAKALGRLESTSSEVVSALSRALQHDQAEEVRIAAVEALARLGGASDMIVSELVGALKDQTASVRRKTVVSLGRLGGGSDKVVKGLVGALWDQDAGVRGTAAEALGYLKGTQEEVERGLVGALQDQVEGVRSRAVAALGRLANVSAEVVNGLIKTLQDKSAKVRGASAEVLGKLGNASTEVVSGLIGALQDQDTGVRYSAAEALGCLRNTKEEVESALVRALQDHMGVVRSSALESLARLESVGAEEVGWLVTTMQNQSPELRISAVQALAKLKDASEVMVDRLVGALEDQDAGVRVSVVQALGKLGKANCKVERSLVRALEDQAPKVRSQVAQVLGKFGSPSLDVVRELVGALKDQDFEVKSNVAEALGKLGNASPEVVNGLVWALKDQNFEVRRNVAEALGKLGNASPEVVSGLVWALKDQNFEVRSNVAEALGKLGNASPEVVSGLVSVLEDQPRVRSSSVEALGKLKNAGTEVVKKVIGALLDYDVGVRRSAAAALGNLEIKNSEDVSILCNALRTENVYVKACVAQVLTRLMKLRSSNLEGKQSEIRFSVREALNEQSIDFYFNVGDIWFSSTFDALWHALWSMSEFDE